MGTLLNLMPPGMLGPDSVNPLNIFNSGATGGFAANSLAGQVINMDGAQVQQYLNQATVSLGSEYFRTAVHMLAPVFKIVSASPDQQTHPVLRRVCAPLDVSAEYAAMMQKSMHIFKGQATRVGDHTRGTTFVISEGAKVMYSVSYGFSHFFVKKALNTAAGVAMMLLVLAETIKSFDEEFERQMLTIMMSCPNIPIAVRDAKIHRKKIPLTDVFSDLLSSLGALNKEPGGAFNRQSSILATRFYNLNRRTDGMLVFCTQPMLFFLDLFKTTGLTAPGDSSAPGQLPIMQIEGTNAQLFKIDFNKGAGPGHDHIFTQEMNITTVFTAKTSRTDYMGTEKFFAAYDGQHGLDFEAILENACLNCLDKNGGDRNSDLGTGFADIPFADIAYEKDEGNNDSIKVSTLLSIACKGNPNDPKMAAQNGAFYRRGDEVWKGAKKFEDIDRARLPTAEMRIYARKFLEKQLATGFYDLGNGDVENGTLGFKNTGDDEAGFVSAKDGNDADLNAFISKVADVSVLSPGITASAVFNVLRIYAGIDTAKDGVLFDGEKIRAKLVEETKKSSTAYATLVATKNTTFYGAVTDLVENEDIFESANAEKAKKLITDFVSSNPETRFYTPQVSDGNGKKQVIEQFGNRSGVGAPGKPVTQGASAPAKTTATGGTINTNATERSLEEINRLIKDHAAKLEDITRKIEQLRVSVPKGTPISENGGIPVERLDPTSIGQFLDAFVKHLYFELPINFRSLRFIHLLGMPQPLDINVYTTNVVYKGHALPSVIPGEGTGYAGMSGMGMDEVAEALGQIQVDTYVRFAVFISDENGFARRDMLLINDVFKKDTPTFLCMNPNFTPPQHVTNTVKYSSEVRDCDGHVFCLFDVKGNSFGEVSSFLGWNFVPEKFISRDSVLENNKFSHAAAPIIMNHMNAYPNFSAPIKTLENSTIFNSDGQFIGLPGITFKETVTHLYKDATGKITKDKEAHRKLWPSNDEWNNAANDLRSGKAISKAITIGSE